MGRLDGRVAIVSGAGTGIGRGIALSLAREGAGVCVAELDPAAAARTAKEIESSGGQALAVATDVRRRSEVEIAVDATLGAFGAVDILVNNAQAMRKNVSFEATTDEDMKLALESGTLATFYFMQTCLPHMKTRGGKIINLASAAGLGGIPGWTSYAVAKEGIRALTKVAAQEWGEFGIQVNAIAPLARTASFKEWGEAHPMLLEAMTSSIPLGRVGDPERDIGAVAVFLASSDSDFVTGMTVMVDGGQYILH